MRETELRINEIERKYRKMLRKLEKSERQRFLLSKIRK